MLGNCGYSGAIRVTSSGFGAPCGLRQRLTGDFGLETQSSAGFDRRSTVIVGAFPLVGLMAGGFPLVSVGWWIMMMIV